MRSLLHMWYTPSELAGEIGVSVQWIRRKAIKVGCPYRTDDIGHIWIDGAAFVEWVKASKPARNALGPGQAWCMVCGPVDMARPITTRPGPNAKIEIMQGTCPKCGRRVNRTKKGVGT